MEVSSVEIWFAVGIICILSEFIIPGIGLLFIGFGALSSSIMIYYSPSLAEYQFVLLGISSFVWFLILLWPLKVFVYGKKPKTEIDSFGIIGMQVKVVEKSFGTNDMGRVSWSGTTMNARFEDEDSSVAQLGDKLYITEVKGNVLICSKKKP